MSEIAKCPLCGEMPRIQGSDPGYYDLKTYHCCGHAVYADNEKPWNQYAAAMEYAMKTAYWFSLPDGIHHPDDARAEKAMEKAETRVLEVFGK